MVNMVVIGPEMLQRYLTITDVSFFIRSFGWSELSFPGGVDD